MFFCGFVMFRRVLIVWGIFYVYFFGRHGGISPELNSFDQIKRIIRPTDVPDSGLLCDLLWADPDKEIMVCAHQSHFVNHLFITMDSLLTNNHHLLLICYRPGMGRKRSRCVVHIWCRRSYKVSKKTRSWSRLPGAPGKLPNRVYCLSGFVYCISQINIFNGLFMSFVKYFLGSRRWIRIFCKTAVGHSIFGTKLLWRIW